MTEGEVAIQNVEGEEKINPKEQVPTIVDLLKCCAVCKQSFAETQATPKLLPCLHTVCEACLSPSDAEVVETNSNGKVTDRRTCGECNSPYTLNSAAITLFTPTDNVFLQETIRAQDNTTKTSEVSKHMCACEENQEAESFCADCKEWLCNQCVSAHKRVRITKDHDILVGESVPKTDNSVADQNLFCKQHRHEKLKFFCEDCQKLTCRDCQLVEHKDHKYQFLNEATVNYKQQLETNLAMMLERSKKLGQVHGMIEQRLTQVKEQHSSIVKQVQCQADTLIKSIIQNARTLLQNVKIASESMARGLAKESTDLGTLLKNYDFCTKFMQNIVNDGSNMSLLSTKATVLRHCGEVYNTPVEAKSLRQMFNVQYKHDCNFLFQNLHRFGAIFVNNQRYHPQDRRGYLAETPPANNISFPGSIYSQPQNDQATRHHMMSLIMQQPPKGGVATSMTPYGKQNIPSTVSTLVSQMMQHPNNRPAQTTTASSWSRQLNIPHPGAQVPNLLNSAQRPPPYQTFQPMKLHHRPSVQQTTPNYGLSAQKNVTQSQHLAIDPKMQLTIPTNQAHLASNRNPAGPPPLIHSPPQNQVPPSNQHISSRPGSADVNMRPRSSDPERPSSSKSDGGMTPLARVKQEKMSGTSEDCVITSARIKGEKGEEPSCSQQSGASPANKDFSAESGASEKNLDDVLNKLPLELGDTFEDIHMETPPKNQTPAPVSEPASQDSQIAQKEEKSTKSFEMSFSDPNDDYCACCHNGGEVLCCETCPRVFHLQCHIPQLPQIPNGVFVCTLCTTEDDNRLSPVPMDPINGMKRKAPSGLTDKEMKICERLLLELFCHANSVAFHEPVSKQVPNYYKIITNPMDFTTIKCKLSRQHFNHYNCVQDFLSDIKLVFINCSTYNTDLSEVGKAGLIVKKSFELLVEKHLPQYVEFSKTYPKIVERHTLEMDMADSEPEAKKAKSVTPPLHIG